VNNFVSTEIQQTRSLICFFAEWRAHLHETPSRTPRGWRRRDLLRYCVAGAEGCLFLASFRAVTLLISFSRIQALMVWEYSS
jgi:hypothetical protein